MGDPVTLVILLAAGEAASPTASAMAQGARDAFAGVVTEMHETPGVPTDADVVAAEASSHPDAVAELVWRDADHRHATLRVHLRQSRRWIERSFAFASTDPGPERGRTLGFAVASILPEVTPPIPPTVGARPQQRFTPYLAPTLGAASAHAAPATAPESAPAPAPAPASAPAPPSASASAPATAPESAPAPAPAPAPALTDTGSAESSAPIDAAPFRPPRLAVDLLAVGALVGSVNTAGGGAAVEWFVLRLLSLRLGASERAGSLDVAQAHISTFVTSAGIALHPWLPTRSVPFAVSIRADYVLVRQSATHFDSDDPSPVTAARWVSGVDTFLDASLLLSSQIAAVAGVGLEDVGAPTYVYVRDVRVATLPVLRAVAEAGFQLRF